jgi:hypothetical protein
MSTAPLPTWVRLVDPGDSLDVLGHRVLADGTQQVCIAPSWARHEGVWFNASMAVTTYVREGREGAESVDEG